MKCPMSNYVMERESGEDEVLSTDCLKEECAWWNANREECAILSIELNLHELAYFTSAIRDNMPQGGKL